MRNTISGIIALCLAAPASGQVLTITITDASAGGTSSVCVAAGPSEPCVCPSLASDWYGDGVPEIVQPALTTGCAPNWVGGDMYTTLAVLPSGMVGISQYRTKGVPFDEIVCCVEGVAQPGCEPGTPQVFTNCAGFGGVGLQLAGEPAAFGVVEWEPTATGFIVTCRSAGDHDKNGTIDVPDIFAFLSDWFTASPRADYGGDGGVAVPDIFTYLSKWFAGE